MTARPPTGYFTQARPEIRDLLVGRDLRVLELGCAAGLLGEDLRQRGIAAVVHGVERDRDAATAAEARLDRVWAADLDGDDLSFLAGPYDAVLAADVLEHLRSPEQLLARVRELLVPHGQLVVSVPNLRYAPVVVPLLVRGRFEYRESGVLDRTHLRFFTRSSVIALLDAQGFRTEAVRRAPMVWRRGWKRVVGRLLGDLGSEQILLRARPA